MSPPTDRAALEDRIREALEHVSDPCSVANGTPMSLEEMGLLDSISVDRDGTVRLRIRLTTPMCLMVGVIGGNVEAALSAIDGVNRVEIDTDSGLDWRPDAISRQAAQRRKAALRRRGLTVHD